MMYSILMITEYFGLGREFTITVAFLFQKYEKKNHSVCHKTLPFRTKNPWNQTLASEIKIVEQKDKDTPGRNSTHYVT